MQDKTRLDISSQYTDIEWQARVDLAAAHRLAYMHDMHEGIFNHLTLIVPGKSDCYYQIPFGTHWSEVTASCFMEVSYDGELMAGDGEIERSCLCIHAPIHRQHPDHATAVFHTHMPHASALSRLEDPRIKPIGQTEVMLSSMIAYDSDYTGPAMDPTEGERLAGLIGSEKILFMANHGVVTFGSSVSEAFDLLYYIERAAQVQLYAMWTGQRLQPMKPEAEQQTRAFKGQTFKRGKPHVYHFDALKRMLDRNEPDYKL
jgi:ribulose-5-phosphate 4-epimerase/fuculose-1-phosphate aldolase